VKYIVTEGNYLLLDREPWSKLRTHFDMTVFLKPDREELRRRLLLRWQSLSGAELIAKIEGNDMVNAETVLNGSSDADFTLAESYAEKLVTGLGKGGGVSVAV
jgi:pantothenate kinase